MRHTYMTITNKYGESGSPCRSHFHPIKYPLSNPLIEIEYIGDMIHVQIQLTNLPEVPTARKGIKKEISI